MIADCLRKYAGENPQNWTDWIPIVMIAYNSKVHSSTQMTPYEVIFGRKMNGFENWQTKTPMKEIVALEERCKEISILNNQIHPKALANIKAQQIIQKKH